MLFPTIDFAFFFLPVFLLAWATRPWPQLNKIWLLVASYAFYGYTDWRFAFLLAACSLANYVLALGIEECAAPARRRLVVVVGVVFNLAVLGFFKYWGFFLSSFTDVLHLAGFGRDIKIMEVLLPVGVSFFTFQGISYIVDVYRRDLKAAESPVDVLLYLSFFPHLVAGPIVRGADFVPQLQRPVDPNNIRATRAFLLICLGLFKKIVIAHYLATELVNPVFESPSAYGTVDLVFAVYGYAVQIYCDFSAYSDMAIGLALLFGYEFKRNFKQPYRAASLQDFWHRWHISLSGFLRDYLYIPLGGSRGGKLLTYRNLFLTMVLGGIWHGASWTFVLWGVLHGTGLCAERFAKERWGKRAGTDPNWASKGSPLRASLRTGLATVLVFHFVCLTWVFFNAETFALATEYLTALGNWQKPSHMVSSFMLGLLALGFTGQFLPDDLLDRLEGRLTLVPLPMQAAGLALAVVAIGAFGPGALAPFIYFKF